MRVAILGAGAMGSWFGGKLAMLGHEVQLLTTNHQHIHAVNSNGLVLQAHGSENTDTTVRLNARTPTEYDGVAELVIVLTKGYQTQAAMEAIAASLHQEAAVLTLQNGLGNADTIAAFVKPENIWIGMSMMPVDRVSPGIVASKGTGQTVFGPWRAGGNEFAAALVEAFEGSGMAVSHDSNVYQRIWEKVAFNCSMNALCALTHGTPGTVGQLAESRALLRAIAAEVADVAKAEGVSIDLDAVFDTIAYACAHHGAHKASMLQDLLAGKRTEVDSLNGAIVERGLHKGIEVPLNAMLTTLVRLAEYGDHGDARIS